MNFAEFRREEDDNASKTLIVSVIRLYGLNRDEVVDGGETGEGGGGRGVGGRGFGCVAASGPRIIGSYRGISANHVKSGRPLCAPRTSHRPKFPSPKLMTNTNAILSASPPSYPPFSSLYHYPRCSRTIRQSETEIQPLPLRFHHAVPM